MNHDPIGTTLLMRILMIKPRKFEGDSHIVFL